MKFGGSSVANAERIKKVIEIIRENLKQKPVIVLSAMGDTTDYLLEAAETALRGGPASIKNALEKITDIHLNAYTGLSLGKTLPEDINALLADLNALLTGISLIKELSARSKDFLVSFGERLSARIVSAALNKVGIPSQSLDAWDAGIISDAVYGAAEILSESEKTVAERILPLLDKGIMPVITGFIAKDADGIITTLGRGGSDLSAAFIAAALKAEEAQVWKDVDGLLTADPRIVPDAAPVAEVTYEEAAELAYFGAQVLHPRTMYPCIKSGIPVRVKNSYNPSAPGTLVIAARSKNSNLAEGTPQHERPVSGRDVRSITTRKNVTLVDIISSRMLGQSGFLARVFAVFAQEGISVDMLATSEVSVSLTLDAAYNLGKVCEELSRIAAVQINTQKAIVTIICDVARSSSILEKAAGVCAGAGITIQMVSQGASKVNISFIVDDTEADTVVRLLHKTFFG
jgi:aspartate kinase